MYLCSMDAEKCFDTIWHAGLFNKLFNVLPNIHWRILHNWYSNMKSVVKWNGTVYNNSCFKITRGTRQGSILSPVLFNVFIADLIHQLNNSTYGIRIGDALYNSFAFADDISLFSRTVPGLQCLINICGNYAKKWRFNFGLAKSKCMCIGPKSDCFMTTPKWYLNGSIMTVEPNLEILGVLLQSDMTSQPHVNNRVNKCRRSLYSLSQVGISYPGLNSSSKCHLYQTVCRPSLLYGMEAIHLHNNVKKLESYQGSVIKHICGLSKRSHHTNLVRAFGLDNISTIIGNRTINLYKHICSSYSAIQQLCFHSIYQYVCHNVIVPGTMLDRIVKLGYSPVSTAFNSPLVKHDTCDNDGLVNSLRNMIYSENFIKPWCDEHVFVKLLTKAF